MEEDILQNVGKTKIVEQGKAKTYSFSFVAILYLWEHQHGLSNHLRVWRRW